MPTKENCPLYCDTKGWCCEEHETCLYEETDARVETALPSEKRMEGLIISSSVGRVFAFAGALILALALALIFWINPARAEEPNYMKAAANAVLANQLCGPIIDDQIVLTLIYRASAQNGVPFDLAINVLKTMVANQRALLDTDAKVRSFCRKAYEITGAPA